LLPSPQVCNQLLQHAQHHNPSDGNEACQWAICGDGWNRLKEAIKNEENINHILQLHHKAKWQKS
jgi:hypothetical protein